MEGFLFLFLFFYQRAVGYDLGFIDSTARENTWDGDGGGERRERKWDSQEINAESGKGYW